MRAAASATGLRPRMFRHDPPVMLHAPPRTLHSADQTATPSWPSTSLALLSTATTTRRSVMAPRVRAPPEYSAGVRPVNPMNADAEPNRRKPATSAAKVRAVYAAPNGRSARSQRLACVNAEQYGIGVRRGGDVGWPIRSVTERAAQPGDNAAQR
jgi:hypothetical protein